MGTKMPSETKGKTMFRGYWSCVIRKPKHNASARIKGPLNLVRLTMVDADDPRSSLSAFRSRWQPSPIDPAIANGKNDIYAEKMPNPLQLELNVL